MAKQYDRSAEDLGNVVGLEHVNLLIPDQGRATLFYVTGLGLTRDPYLMTNVDNMWINAGRSQFHVANFHRQHSALDNSNIATEESNQYQDRSNDIVETETGNKLFEIEHENRSTTPPPYARALANRIPR